MSDPPFFGPSFDHEVDRAAGSTSSRRTASVAAVRGDPFRFPRLDRPGEPVGPAARTFSEAELQAALAAERGAAQSELRAELASSLKQRQTEALQAIAAQLAAARAALDRAIAARAVASRDLALALARALVPRALARQPLADVEAMLRDLIARLEGYPRLELRLPAELAEPGEALLALVAREVGYPGALAVIADPALGPGDARLAWRDGAATRALAELETEAVAVVDAWLPPAVPAGVIETTPAESPSHD